MILNGYGTAPQVAFRFLNGAVSFRTWNDGKIDKINQQEKRKRFDIRSKVDVLGTYFTNTSLYVY